MRQFDYSRLQNMLWSSEVVSLLSQIHEYKGRQELWIEEQPYVLSKLVELAKVQSVEASNRIEGIVTTEVRMRDLMAQKSGPRNRDEEEIAGYRDVLATIHENYEYIRLSSNIILQLHRDLYMYSHKSMGGHFKNVQNSIIERLPAGEEIERFRPLAAYETPGAISQICESLEQTLAKQLVDPLLLIPIFIHDFLCIHPFNDGNGRMSRLLTTLLLYRTGYMVGKYISLERHIDMTKEMYYRALSQSGVGWHDGNEDIIPFVTYILRIILAAYRDFESRTALVNTALTAKEKIRISLDKTIGKITKSQLVIEHPELGVSTIERSLKELVEDGYIEKQGKGRSTFYIRK